MARLLPMANENRTGIVAAANRALKLLIQENILWQTKWNLRCTRNGTFTGNGLWQTAAETT